MQFAIAIQISVFFGLTINIWGKILAGNVRFWPTVKSSLGCVRCVAYPPSSIYVS